MTMLRKIESTLAAVLLAITASAAATWSDTPVTCHWIGTEYAGRSGSYDYAEWTNAANWAEGIVPGRFEKDGATVGCEGCTAVFDRDCSYSTVGLSGFHSISNVIVSGASVPMIRFGQTTSSVFYFERHGGVFVASDVATAPQFRGPFRYRRGAENTVTTLYFENNSSTPLTISGFKGPDTAFGSNAGDVTLVMRGTGVITCNGSHDRSKYALRILLEMSGGKFIQAYTTIIDKIAVEANKGRQHFEISSGKTVTSPTSIAVPVSAQSDLIIDGDGTYAISATADSAAFAIASGNTLTIDCSVTRPEGKKFQIGHGTYSGGTVVLAAGRSFNTPVDFYSGALRLADGETFSYLLSIMNDHASRKGTISGGREIEAKITGGVAGVGHALTLTNRLAIACDITATTTVAADAEISFRKADEAATTSFTVSSLTLAGNKTVPVEDGVTATVAAINNNGYTLDIRPSGSGKVLFTGLSAGRAPEWLMYNGAKARIAPDHTLIGPKGFCIKFH